MVQTDSGPDIAAEILPVIAKELTQARALVQKTHYTFLQHHKMPELVFEELNESESMWTLSNRGYVSPQVRTVMPTYYASPPLSIAHVLSKAKNGV